MNFLWYAGAFLLALGVLVVVHEFGHFLVARWSGVQVLRFSVGFGKPLVVKKWGRDQTEWALAAFPLGGYVKMLDEREAPVPPHLLHRAFNRQSVWKRMAIVVAGPVANLLLAIAIYCGVFMQGVTDLKPVLDTPIAGTPAARAGFKSGDMVQSVDDEAVTTWTELRKIVLNGTLDKRVLAIKVETAGGQSAMRQLDASAERFADTETDPAQQIGLVPMRPPLDPMVGGVAPSSPAALAGIRPGDVIVMIDGERVVEWEQVVQHVRPAYGKPLALEVEREHVPYRFTLIPARADENGKPVGRLGISVKPDPARYAPMMIEVKYGIVEALPRAVAEVWNTSVLSLRMMGRMIVGEVSLKNLSGPVTIADYAGQTAKMGISPYLRFIALISISLGVLNLLPIPVLDGGHLMYYLAELFKGSPVSDRVLEVGQKFGFGILGLLMVCAFYNDIHRLIAG